MTSEGPALSIENLSFTYPGAPAPALTIGSYTLGRAEQALLAGGSGTGKSTLLQLIAGLLDPDAGSLKVSGVDIHSLRGARRDLFRGKAIGVIFQTFNLLDGFTACENVMAALMFSDIPRKEHRSRALGLLERLRIERPNAVPAELSVGQQQRVAVARAVACDPVLVLADEPTTSLDPKNASNAMDLIEQTCKDLGAALLCTSHDPAVWERFESRAELAELNTASSKG